MTWYYWIVLGMIAGIIFTITCIIASTYIIMHNQRLQQKYMGKVVRSMMARTRP